MAYDYIAASRAVVITSHLLRKWLLDNFHLISALQQIEEVFHSVTTLICPNWQSVH
jgi:hypothetical protein